MGSAYSAAPAASTSAGVNAPSGFHVSFLSWRVYYEGLGTFTAPNSRASFGTATGVNLSSPNAYNSRSPAASGQYGSANGLNATVMIVAVTDCQHFCWIAGCRYPYISQNADRGIRAPQSTNGGGVVTCVGLDNWPTSTRRIAKWASRARGYWWRLGNEIHLHAKTGSGAFSMIMPHFDTDVSWFSPSSWALGSNQTDVWNINLFGPTGFMVGTADINLSTGTAAITGAGALVGSAAIILSTGAATLNGAGAVVASAAITLSTGTATITGAGALVSTAAITLSTGTAALTGAGSLVATGSITISTGATTLLGLGSMTGSTQISGKSITVDSTGILQGSGNLSALGTITIDATGIMIGPINVPSFSKRIASSHQTTRDPAYRGSDVKRVASQSARMRT